MQVSITPVTSADDDASEALYQVRRAAWAHDIPDFPPHSRSYHDGRLRHPSKSQVSLDYVAVTDGRPVGALTLALPQLDNLHMVEVTLEVHPDHRRQGVGWALHAHTVAVAREHGRRCLIGEYLTALPGGAPRDPAFAAFAETVGAKAALTEARRRLDLEAADQAEWDRLLDTATPHAEGYSVVRWTDTTPEEYIDDVAALDGRLLLDAPIGDLDMEPQKVDAARVRHSERTHRARGERRYNTGIRHDASGRLVAWTAIGFDADIATHAWQQITIVDPGHRGHRLGLIVKIENLRQTLATEPGLRHVNTWNAVENAHMIAINEQLGFRAVDAWVECQQEV